MWISIHYLQRKLLKSLEVYKVIHTIPYTTISLYILINSKTDQNQINAFLINPVQEVTTLRLLRK